MTEAAERQYPGTTQELVRVLVPVTASLIADAHDLAKLQPNPPGEHNVHLFSNRLHAVSPGLANAVRVVHEVEIGARKGADSLSARERKRYGAYAPIVDDMKAVVAANSRLRAYDPIQSERVARDVVSFYRLTADNLNGAFEPMAKVNYQAATVAGWLGDQNGFVLSPLMEDVLNQSELPTVKLEVKEIADAGRDVFQAINNKLAKRPELQRRGFSLFMSTEKKATMTLRNEGRFEKTLQIGKDGSIRYKYDYSATDGNGSQKVTLHVDAKGVVTSFEASFVEMEGDKPQAEVDTHMAYQKALSIVRRSRP